MTTVPKMKMVNFLTLKQLRKSGEHAGYDDGYDEGYASKDGRSDWREYILFLFRWKKDPHAFGGILKVGATVNRIYR